MAFDKVISGSVNIYKFIGTIIADYAEICIIVLYIACSFARSVIAVRFGCEGSALAHCAYYISSET